MGIFRPNQLCLCKCSQIRQTVAQAFVCISSVIEGYGFGLCIQTKSDRILRDLDLLKRINQRAKCVVQMTLTTYDEDLCRIIEPGVCTTKRRFEVLSIVRDSNIPTVVWLSPILPFVNDTEDNLRGILDYCIKAKVFSTAILILPRSAK